MEKISNKDLKMTNYQVMMNGAELTEISNLEERGENRLNPRTGFGEREGGEIDNLSAPAVERGPIDLEKEILINRTQTHQTAEKEMIREEEHEEVSSREEEMRDPFLEELPSREEDGIEMEELIRNKEERDELERERRKRRREEEHRGYQRSGEEPEKRQ